MHLEYRFRQTLEKKLNNFNGISVKNEVIH